MAYVTWIDHLEVRIPLADGILDNLTKVRMPAILSGTL